jgi:hypothetical protein
MATWHVGFVLGQCRSVGRKLTLYSDFVHLSYVIVSIIAIVTGMGVLCAVRALDEDTYSLYI